MVAKKMRALYDCSADESGELSFKEGDILVDVEESGEEGWYKGRIQNTLEIGLFPYNYVEALLDEDDGNSTNVYKKKQQENSKDVENNTESTLLLSKFPALDAFEAVMSNGKMDSTKLPSAWKPLTPTSDNIKQSSPAIKPKTISSINKNDTIGSSVKINDNPSTLEKSKLKPVGINDQGNSSIRLKTYSTLSTVDNSENPLKPSQLLNGSNNSSKDALEIALCKSTSKPLSNTRINSFKKQVNNDNGVALAGMNSMKFNNRGKDDFQILKPSQIRQKQQSSSSPKPFASKSLTLSSSPIFISKPSITKKPFLTNENNNPKSSTAGSKLDALGVSNNPMPPLPSRPVSLATRRSRTSKSSSSSIHDKNPKDDSVRNAADVSPIKKLTEKTPPKIQKPKPQITSPSPSLPKLPQRLKSRSASNPPPIRPKPSDMSSIDVLLNRNNAKNQNSAILKSAAPPPITAKKPSFQNTKSNSDINITHLKPKSIPKLPTRINNINPSALMNRGRSATSPISKSNIPTDWTAPQSNTCLNSVALNKENDTKSTTHSVLASENPPSVTATIGTITTDKSKKKSIPPPPPPPSRPPKSSLNNNASKHRYDILFDDIQDNGYVDGETIHFIWSKSKLSNENLARIWRECGPDPKGLLDRQSFFDGMTKIDELLSSKQ
ncbi:uncharacterized protein BX663DRAFT_214543 [Cokeromyces recurvatus]|uniref:uncharacterized protein n=1 Tax=Cokeromyces recurvatus TaxID=90255 RepID=UPI00221F9859|nr:uncharacterized protein BX663DRAFT_214543 [Cokeromyces recurvatus]KAI7899427.1 hypothetical protein BX663DRAFT_214543 [Cokeromyces recurvatus]